MKNKEQKTESLFKKKGFYVALYSCLGVVMISAAVLSFTSLLRDDSQSPINTQAELDLGVTDLGELQAADKSDTRSYLTPQDKIEISQAFPTSAANITGTPRPTSAPYENQASVDVSAETQATTDITDAGADLALAANTVATPTAAPAVTPASTPAPTAKTSDAITEPTESLSTKESPPDSNTANSPELSSPSLEEAASYTPYSAEAPMNWPLVGELVMDFSTDRLVFDATLNQYRTNNNLCIGAAIGTQVKATAPGVVKEITTTREKGNTIIIDHGNGWNTLYSELQDGILVSIGDVVEEGQVIGGVGTPSIYNVLLGSHLQFAVVKDGTTIDPKTVLAN